MMNNKQNELFRSAVFTASSLLLSGALLPYLIFLIQAQLRWGEGASHIDPGHAGKGILQTACKLSA